jgi:xanthine/CO dehydrogenase XdhC/CoxF family maturation factor
MGRPSSAAWLSRGFSAAELASKLPAPLACRAFNGKEPEVIAVAVAAQLLQA